MIPKIIHYWWFGKSAKPASVLEYIETWKRVLPDYRIMEWNETNFDFRKWKFCREAYAVKKYAFVADVCRMYALSNSGGVYLDTDIEVIKSFNPFLQHQSFIGEERLHTIGPGVIGAEPNTPWVCEFLEMYKSMKFIKYNGRLLDYPNTMYLTNFLHKRSQDLPTIYPIEFFCAKDYETKKVLVTDNTVCIHHYAASWFEKLTLIGRLHHLCSKILANII